MFVSCDVIFHEDVSLFPDKQINEDSAMLTNGQQRNVSIKDDLDDLVRPKQSGPTSNQEPPGFVEKRNGSDIA